MIWEKVSNALETMHVRTAPAHKHEKGEIPGWAISDYTGKISLPARHVRFVYNNFLIQGIVNCKNEKIEYMKTIE